MNTNTAYSLAGRFVIASALVLTIFVAYIITNATANVRFENDGGNYHVVQANKTA